MPDYTGLAAGNRTGLDRIAISEELELMLGTENKNSYKALRPSPLQRGELQVRKF